MAKAIKKPQHMKKKHYYVLAWSKILREIYIYPDKESAENDENIMLSKNVDDVTRFNIISEFLLSIPKPPPGYRVKMNGIPLFSISSIMQYILLRKTV